MLRKTLLSLLIGSTVAGTALAFCDPYTLASIVCPDPNFYGILVHPQLPGGPDGNALLANDDDDDDDGNCPGSERMCVHRTQPPPAEFTFSECTYSGGTLLCQAWPIGPGLTYRWQVSGMLHLGYPPGAGDSAVSIDCLSNHGGSVRLTVTSPYGLSSVSQKSYACTPTDIQ